MDLPVFVRAAKGGVVVETFVQPRATRNAIAGIQAGALKVKVTAPPVDDRANRAVEALLAEAVGLPKSHVRVHAGHSSRHKRVVIEGASAAAVAAALRERLA